MKNDFFGGFRGTTGVNITQELLLVMAAFVENPVIMIYL